MDYTTIGLGVAMFCVVVVAMVGVLLFAKGKLVASGEVDIVINGDEEHPAKVAPGSTLLSTLSNQKIFIPSACGGGGTCAQCKVQVLEGGGSLLPTEEGHITRGQAKEHWRLSCQVKVKENLKIRVPDEVFSVRKWECEVVSNHNVATFIKEFRVRLPEGEKIDFTSGDYIQIEIPPHDVSFRDFEIDEEYREDWDKYDLWRYRSTSTETMERAYSMANYPGEGGEAGEGDETREAGEGDEAREAGEGDDIVMLNVRIAPPPPRGPEGIPPGKGSSYIFSTKPGDKVTVSGPFGEFHIKPTNREMVFIGGGAGMAPLRSHIMRMLKTERSSRKISYWYGARSRREMFYVEDFDELQKEFPNFQWHVALSEPLPEDHWKGYTGFIHQVVLDQYLAKHSEPEEIEYYLCGPPMMNRAVLEMLDNLGVDPEMIALDDFGG